MKGASDKRVLFLEAAIGLIGDEGLNGFTTPKVARRAGLRQSHLTYYFPTREDLLVAVAERVVTDRIATLGAVAEARTPAAKVRSLAAILVDPEQTRLLLALIQTADRVTQVAGAFDRLRTGIAPGSEALLRAWRIDATADALQLLQATSTGIAVLALANDGPAFRRAAERILSRLLRELSASPSRPRTGPTT